MSIQKHIKTGDDGRKFIKIEDVWTQEDVRRAERITKNRQYGTIEETIYEVVLRRLKNQGHSVSKRRYTDASNIIFIKKQSNV